MFADADLDAAVRGAPERHLLRQGRGLRGRQPPARRAEGQGPGRRAAGRARRRRSLPAIRSTQGNPARRDRVAGADEQRAAATSPTGKREGATAGHGGERTTVDGKGYFVQATIFDGVTAEMTIAREEIFGPVLAVHRIRRAGGGASASRTIRSTGSRRGLWTRDIGKAHRVAQAIRAGTVWINTYNIYDPAVPVRRLQAVGLRPRSGDGRARRLHADENGMGVAGMKAARRERGTAG